MEEHLIELPSIGAPAVEPSLPTTTTAWEPTDGLRAIDWTASVLAHGPLAPAMPLRRELWPDDDLGQRDPVPSVEIYLDTSGSMPNPSTGLNAMNLAALVVATAATRASGRVRGLIYSSSHEVSEWMYDEAVARRFWLRFQGAGAVFPFERARQLADQDRDAMRLVISDADFLFNCRAEGVLEQLSETIERSRLTTLLLLLPSDHHFELAKKQLQPALRHPRCGLTRVASRKDLPAAAAALSRALLGE